MTLKLDAVHRSRRMHARFSAAWHRRGGKRSELFKRQTLTTYGRKSRIVGEQNDECSNEPYRNQKNFYTDGVNNVQRTENAEENFY